MSNDWTVDDIPDQNGKIAVVTGANSGLGFETTRQLALHGAQVVLACRDHHKGDQAKEKILHEDVHAQVEVLILDLADLESVRAFANAFKAKYEKLDILVNNAGVMALPYRKTADGFEMQFGTNHLGHFALTGLLLDRLLAADRARVTTVSSLAHKGAEIDFDDLQSEDEYDKWEAYGQSKLANLLFTYELQRKFETADTKAISNAAHPGYTATNLQTAGPKMAGSTIRTIGMKVMNGLLAQDTDRGALPQIYAAAAVQAKGGAYYGPDGWMEARGYPVRVESSPESHDKQAAARLWQVSAELTGVTYEPLTAPQKTAAE